MRLNMTTASVRLSAALLCLVSLAPVLHAAAPKAAEKSADADDKPLPYVPGEKWKITSQVAMPGMSMPPNAKMPAGKSMPPGMAMPGGMGMGGGMGMPSQAMEVCQAKGTSSTQAAEQQKNCTITNKRMVAGKQSAHMACKFDGHAMEGDVDMESLGPDHYRTTMHMTTESGAMDMVTEGEKIGGDCDANEMKRKGQEMVAKANVMKAEGDKAIAQQCHDMATQMQLQAFGKDNLCQDPADRALLCKTAQSYESFGNLLNAKRHAAEFANDPNPYMRDQGRRLDDIVAFCSAGGGGMRGMAFNPEELKQKLCGTAEKDGAYVYLAEQCPVQADPLGAKICTSGMEESPEQPVEPKYRAFCAAWLDTDEGRGAAAAARAKAAEKEKLKKGNGKQPSQSDKAKEAIDKAKSKLKGLFGG